MKYGKAVRVSVSTHEMLIAYVEKQRPERVSIASVIDAAVSEYLAKRR